MYKVFINEKKITISKSTNDFDKNLPFEGSESIDKTLTLIEDPTISEINLYGEDLAEIWEEFTSTMHIIEAAGGVVFNSLDQILFIHRLGKWDLPKGKLEDGEQINDAAIREVEEETGLQELSLDNFINPTFHIYHDTRIQKKVLKITYWFKMKHEGNESLTPQTEEGITEVKWISVDEIPSIVYPNTFQNIKLILEDLIR